MERTALKNKSHFSFIQKPRGQTKAWLKGRRIQIGHSRLRELFIHQQKEFERKKAEIREREEKRKRTYAERQERERRYSEKLRNETLEERERERVFQQEKSEMEDLSLISWKDDGGNLSEILPDWFVKISVKFLSELLALLKREKFGALIKLSTRREKNCGSLQRGPC